MALRFTNTDKWQDSWFSELRPIEKLLWQYLCDNCDIAGFIEIRVKNWAFAIGEATKEIDGAFEGLKRGFVMAKTGDCIYLKKFLFHQKNLPLNPSNKAHSGIIKRFELYASKFGITDIDIFINKAMNNEGAFEGLTSPTGIGNGKGKKFIKPNINTITEYCTVRKNTVDPIAFFNFYESKGWMVGSNHMKDWKAAVRTWEQKEKQNSNGSNQNKRVVAAAGTHTGEHL